MELRSLRYFVAVADELHFGRAAERLGMAQPPLTVAIQKLERDLGVQLIVRGRQNRLTDAGLKLAEEARRLLAHSELAVEATRRVARGDAGELRVGVPPSVMLTGLPQRIRAYRRRYPEVAFTLREMGTSAIEVALQRREIDLGFLREVRVFKSSLYLEEPLVAVLPTGHKLAGKAPLSPSALKREPFVFFPRAIGPAFYDAMVAAAGFAPQVAQEATQWQTVVSLVEAGMGVSIAPACVEKLRLPGVVFRPLKNAITHTFAAWHEGAPATVARFLAPDHARGAK
jgi:DNA-binding transcriptional LysR family regulator